MKSAALFDLNQGFLKGSNFDFFVAAAALVDLHINDILKLYKDGQEYQFKIVGMERRRVNVDQIPEGLSGEIFLKSTPPFLGKLENGMKLYKD
jgi:hypothetical protein